MRPDRLGTARLRSTEVEEDPFLVIFGNPVESEGGPR